MIGFCNSRLNSRCWPNFQFSNKEWKVSFWKNKTNSVKTYIFTWWKIFHVRLVISIQKSINFTVIRFNCVIHLYKNNNLEILYVPYFFINGKFRLIFSQKISCGWNRGNGTVSLRYLQEQKTRFFLKELTTSFYIPKFRYFCSYYSNLLKLASEARNEQIFFVLIVRKVAIFIPHSTWKVIFLLDISFINSFRFLYTKFKSVLFYLSFS